MGEGSLSSFPPQQSILFIFSSHQNNCPLLIFTILTTLDNTLTSMVPSNRSTSSAMLGHAFFFQLFVLFRCSFSFNAFCNSEASKINPGKQFAEDICRTPKQTAKLHHGLILMDQYSSLLQCIPIF